MEKAETDIFLEDLLLDMEETNMFFPFFYRFKQLFLNPIIQGFFYGVGSFLGAYVCKKLVLPKLGIKI
jgi:hypothetical protein